MIVIYPHILPKQIKIKIDLVLISLIFCELSNFYLIDHDHILYESIISFNSSLLKSVEIKTSWAVFPLLAIALYPFIVFTDNLNVNFEDLPLTLEITAGVIVFIFILLDNFCNTGIRPSILEL